MLYFDLWGGSPATTTIVEGIETTEINDGSSVSRESPNSNDDSQTNSPVELEIEDDDGVSTDSTSTSRIKSKKRDKDQELKRKLPVDVQLLNVCQEELQVKKQLIEKMANMDNTYFDHIERLANNQHGETYRVYI